MFWPHPHLNGFHVHTGTRVTLQALIFMDGNLHDCQVNHKNNSTPTKIICHKVIQYTIQLQYSSMQGRLEGERVDSSSSIKNAFEFLNYGLIRPEFLGLEIWYQNYGTGLHNTCHKEKTRALQSTYPTCCSVNVSVSCMPRHLQQHA